MTTAIFAAVAISCKKDKTPAWFTDAQAKFGNGRFVPEMQDIVPASMLGADASTKAVAGISAKNVEDYQMLPFSAIKGASTDGIEKWLSYIANWRMEMLELKTEVLEDFERRSLTQQNVWVDGVKFEENATGQHVYRTRDNPHLDYSDGVKLSMHSDGANEIYYFRYDAGGNPVGRSYSYLKGDRYIFVSVYSDGFGYLSSDIENGVRKGKAFIIFNDAVSGEKGYDINVFRGDAEDFVSHILQDRVMGGTIMYLEQQAYSIINGVICPYNDNRIDLRAFANIAEIFYEQAGYRDYRLHGIKLVNGTIIDQPENLPGYFSFQEAEEFRENELNGYWQTFPTDGYSIGLWLNFSGGTETLSGGIPAPLSQLQLADGFEELYTTLKTASAGYFDNFYITEFAPIATIKLNTDNIGAIINAVSAYIETHHEGF